jgi:hypothetical protein
VRQRAEVLGLRRPDLVSLQVYMEATDLIEPANSRKLIPFPGTSDNYKAHLCLQSSTVPSDPRQKSSAELGWVQPIGVKW